ncbi:hypothetical protein, partial [Bacillus cereus]|uniref:hypothetical protein n=1 Tax=Bacillus cereus TaxID=1396 RepID=UPI00196AB330
MAYLIRTNRIDLAHHRLHSYKVWKRQSTLPRAFNFSLSAHVSFSYKKHYNHSKRKNRKELSKMNCTPIV